MTRIVISVLLSAVLIWLHSTSPANQHLNNSITKQNTQTVTTVANETNTIKQEQPVTQPPEVIEPEKQQEEQKPVVHNLSDHESLMQQAGIDQNEWAAAAYIISHESGWCHLKWEGQIGYCPESYTQVYDPTNPYKGYGYCQSTPAIKMASTETDWQTNPITQLKWCTAYAKSRYGGWNAAYEHWKVAHRW